MEDVVKTDFLTEEGDDIECKVYMSDDYNLPFDIKINDQVRELNDKDMAKLIRHLQRMRHIKKTGVLK